MLVVGDSHIRERADEIPREFYEYFSSNSYDIVIHTGDLVDPDVIDLFKNFGKEFYVVEGNMDYLNLPDHHILGIYGIRIGIVHGHQVRPRGDLNKLTKLGRELGVIILISGHTHSPFIEFSGDILHVNPGSVTGVWGGGGGSMIPSFAELEIFEDSRLIATLYELRRGEVMKLKRIEHRF
ncbi:MAG: YfcE family phosphodiesterase [Sulfolobales archaeon]